MRERGIACSPRVGELSIVMISPFPVCLPWALACLTFTSNHHSKFETPYLIRLLQKNTPARCFSWGKIWVLEIIRSPLERDLRHTWEDLKQRASSFPSLKGEVWIPFFFFFLPSSLPFFSFFLFYDISAKFRGTFLEVIEAEKAVCLLRVSSPLNNKIRKN